MSFAPAHWELPGPSAFVARVVEQAQLAGIVAVITPKHCPNDLDGALRDRLGVFDLPTIDARQGAPPLQALSRVFEIELKSARFLASTTVAEGQAVFVTGLDEASVSRWETTLRAYIAGCGARPRFGAMLFVGASPDCLHSLLQIGVKCNLWRNVIGFRDALLWALRHQEINDPVLGRLAAETAVCLAGWELDEVRRQMRRLLSARAIFESPASCGGQDSPSWAQGEIDDFDSVPSTRLALCNSVEISRRMWRAQVTVLFGWLETLRSDFVHQHRGWLQQETRASSRSIDTSSMEWGELHYLAVQSLPAGDRRRRLAESARSIRNALAHGEAVSHDMFHRLIQCIGQPLRG